MSPFSLKPTKNFYRLFGSHILPNVIQKFLKLRGEDIFFLSNFCHK